MPEGDSTGRIVVGVDGSDVARRALAWALDEGRLRKWSVIAVHSYMIPPLLMVPEATPVGPPTVPDPGLIEQLEERAKKLVGDELDQADTSDVAAEGRVGSGTAADVLLQAAQDADLLVVGTRGKGGFTGLLLGSVSGQVAHHAPCPVVIVPRSRD